MPSAPETAPAFAVTTTAGGVTCCGKAFGSTFWASVPLNAVWTPATLSLTEPSRCGTPVIAVAFVVGPSRPTGSPCVRATSAPNDQPKADSGCGGGADVWNVHATAEETPCDV